MIPDGDGDGGNDAPPTQKTASEKRGKRNREVVLVRRASVSRRVPEKSL